MDSVPQGWKLVPLQSTDEMNEAAAIYFQNCRGLGRAPRYSEAFRRMAEAAPTPCTQQDVEDFNATPPLPKDSAK